NDASFLQDAGIRVTGDLPTLDVSSWLNWMNHQTTKKIDLPFSIDLSIAELILAEMSFNNMKIQFNDIDKKWMLEGPKLSGHIDIPSSTNPMLVLNLEKLALTLPKKESYLSENYTFN